jgi:hypothetical protein
MAGVVVDIYSDNPKVKEMIDAVLKHNDKEFQKAGFRVECFKEKFGYSVAVVPFTMTASLGFKIGKYAVVKGLKSTVKKIDSTIKVEERKGDKNK